jgi:cytochrome c oxidase cbb3-type subunit 4
MIELSYDALASFAKSWGLFYLMGFSIAVLVYAFRPSKKKVFDRAANQILEDDDTPCR